MKTHHQRSLSASQGIELTRKKAQHLVFGMTAPLITTSDGKKMGKSAAGAVWLNADLVRRRLPDGELFFLSDPPPHGTPPARSVFFFVSLLCTLTLQSILTVLPRMLLRRFKKHPPLALPAVPVRLLAVLAQHSGRGRGALPQALHGAAA